MKKIIVLILTALFLLSCAHQQDLTEEEKEAYRRERARYEAGQRGGP
jgi:PBP1b-binding outer membrane lipoprotein LpoB